MIDSLDPLDSLQQTSVEKRRALMQAADALLQWQQHYVAEHGRGLVSLPDFFMIGLGLVVRGMRETGVPLDVVLEIVKNTYKLSDQAVNEALKVGPLGVVK